MKKIKRLLPLWLVLLYFGSAAYMFQFRTENNDRYRELVETARSCAKNEVMTDAAEAYEEALAIHPNVELAAEAGEVFLANEAYPEAKKWYRNELYANYPDEELTYDYGIRMYLAQEHYRDAFSVYDECRSRELGTEKIEELMRPVLYSFDLSGRYDEVRPFGNLSGIAAVRYGDYWGYIDDEGGRVLDYTYLSAGMFSDLAAVVDQNGKAYFTDRGGNKKITDKSILEQDPEIGQVQQFLGIEGGVLWAWNGQAWSCYDAETLKRLFGGYSAVTNIANGIGAVRNEASKWAVIAADGTALTDFIYDDVRTDEKQVFCRTGIVFVKEGENWCLLNQEGKPVGDQVYEDACAFYDTTCAAVKRGGEWVYIDAEGQEQELGSYEAARSFSNGLAAVRSGGKWGYIDQEGRLVIDCQFDEAGPFAASGVAFVKPEGESCWKLLSLYKDHHE